MADPITARSPMRDTEEQLGVRPIDEILADRAKLVERVSDLRARFGSFGTFDHLRKIELSRLAGLVRAQAMRDKIKMTAAETDDAAHSHPDYRDFITAATSKRAEWVKVESQIEAIDATIQRANAIVRYITSEARL